MAAEKKEVKKTEKDPNLELVDFEIPKERQGKNPDVVISVNGKDWQIKRGYKVKVPLYVKKAYECSLAQSEKAYDYEEEQSNID